MVTQALMGSASLSRQGSFYGLTLDEVQHQLGNLGKPLGSMNLDELLRSVWSGEAIDSGFSNATLQIAADSPLTKKTVEEVWREIQQGKHNDEERNQERQNTLGEMTLEDFLAQAGVVVEKNDRSCNNSGSDLRVDVNVTQSAQWVQCQMVPHGYFVPDTELTVSPLSDTQATGRKRVAPGGVVERTVERRQKRMIKNRESAARSRARKQAYTNELENKVSQLEEENERLRRMKEMEKSLPCTAPPEPKYQLRRTSSAPS